MSTVDNTPVKTPRKARPGRPTKEESAAKVRDSIRETAERAKDHFKILANSLRLQILLHLKNGDMHAGELLENVGTSQANVSYQIAILRHSGLIRTRKEGRNSFYYLTETGRHLMDAVQNV